MDTKTKKNKTKASRPQDLVLPTGLVFCFLCFLSFLFLCLFLFSSFFFFLEIAADWWRPTDMQQRNQFFCKI